MGSTSQTFWGKVWLWLFWLDWIKGNKGDYCLDCCVMQSTSQIATCSPRGKFLTFKKLRRDFHFAEFVMEIMLLCPHKYCKCADLYNPSLPLSFFPILLFSFFLPLLFLSFPSSTRFFSSSSPHKINPTDFYFFFLPQNYYKVVFYYFQLFSFCIKSNL